MKHGSSRRFTLADGMVLLVAIAAGLAVPRTFSNLENVRRSVDVSFWDDPKSTSHVMVSTAEYSDYAGSIGFPPRAKRLIIYAARQASIWPGPGLTALSLAVLVLGGGPIRRLGRRPGMAAGGAVLLAVAVTALRCPQLLMHKGSLSHFRDLGWPQWWLEFWFTLPRVAGLTVAASWLTLALGRRWRVGRGWADRLGVALGSCWIGVAAI